MLKNIDPAKNPSSLFGYEFDEKLNKQLNFNYDRGLIWQIYCADWTLDTYRQYIDEAKHLINPVRDVVMFDTWFFEVNSKTGPLQLIISHMPHLIYMIY